MADRAKEKLSGLLYEASRKADPERYIFDQIADYLIAHGVTVRNEPIKIVIPGDIDEKVLMETIRNSHMQILPGETLQEWISVKDRLPDLELSNAKANDMDLFPCLCVIPHKRAKNGRYVTKLWYTGEGFIDGNNVYCDEVTHWMPIPQPPKGE